VHRQADEDRRHADGQQRDDPAAKEAAERERQRQLERRRGEDELITDPPWNFLCRIDDACS